MCAHPGAHRGRLCDDQHAGGQRLPAVDAHLGHRGGGPGAALPNLQGPAAHHGGVHHRRVHGGPQAQRHPPRAGARGTVITNMLKWVNGAGAHHSNNKHA
eukprot:1194120-Prorocentrum_minimum.AAC.6